MIEGAIDFTVITVYGSKNAKWFKNWGRRRDRGNRHKPFPISNRFNYQNWLFPTLIKFSVLKSQSQLWKVVVGLYLKASNCTAKTHQL